MQGPETNLGEKHGTETTVAADDCGFCGWHGGDERGFSVVLPSWL